MYSLKENNTPIYGNCRILDPNGDLISLCLPKKIQWYLSRNLGDIVCDEPLTIQLNFVPKGRIPNNDFYVLSEKKNECVVCGTNEDLTRHHIVPHCYRQFFPEEIKAHNSHDVVPICTKHHQQYEEEFAIYLKHELSKKYKAPIDFESSQENDLTIVVKYSKLLCNKFDELPYSKKRKFIKFIRKYHGPYGKLYNVVMMYSSVNLRKTKGDPHGKIVIDKVIKKDGLQEFIVMWRKNFINSMKPKHMPKHWSIKRKI